jgi:hypothetical protein
MSEGKDANAISELLVCIDVQKPKPCRILNFGDLLF